MKRLCVFCGSSLGRREAYGTKSQDLGRVLAEKRIELVYGGGNCGLMGVLANAVLQHGGKVIGVIPEELAAKEVGHNGLTDQHVVAGMHERKALMSQMSDGFIALPGGLGTLEELFEVMTWAQLGLQKKPIGLLNVEGYFDPVLALIEHGIGEGFVKPEYRNLWMLSASPVEIVDALTAFCGEP